MKKIFLLFVIVTSFFAASAQYARTGFESLASKNSQSSAPGFSSAGILENITVYPNPVVDNLKITFKSNSNGIVIISFYNNIGKQVFTQESEIQAGNNFYSIDIRSKGIEPGIYFVQLVVDGDVTTRKLIVK